MAPRRCIVLTVGEDVEVMFRKIRQRDGISDAAQVRKALCMWFESRAFSKDVQDVARRAVKLKVRFEKLEPMQLVSDAE
jgi:hypothetical protein